MSQTNPETNGKIGATGATVMGMIGRAHPHPNMAGGPGLGWRKPPAP